jgi:diguanylate cyclase (GGDEF)-like protein
VLALLDDGSHAAVALGRVLGDAEPHHKRVRNTERSDLLAASCVVAPLEPSLVMWLRVRGSRAPVIFFAEGAPREAVRAAFAAGAQEVLDPAVQPPAEILRALTHARERHIAMPVREPSALADAVAVDRSAKDPLTGLLNHRALLERLRDEVALARRHGRSLSLAIIDVDRFAGINRQYGYDAGDEMLQGLAERIGRIARTGDPVARVGADELAWLMLDTALDGADVATRRAGTAIRTVPFGAAGQCTASIGYASLDDAADDVELYRIAAESLERAKGGGGDRAVTHRFVEFES